MKSDTLHNGICLPAEWPPRTMDPSTREPMPVPYLDSPPPVIPIDVGRQLFVDSFPDREDRSETGVSRGAEVRREPDTGARDGSRTGVGGGHGVSLRRWHRLRSGHEKVPALVRGFLPLGSVLLPRPGTHGCGGQRRRTALGAAGPGRGARHQPGPAPRVSAALARQLLPAAGPRGGGPVRALQGLPLHASRGPRPQAHEAEPELAPDVGRRCSLGARRAFPCARGRRHYPSTTIPSGGNGC